MPEVASNTTSPPLPPSPPLGPPNSIYFSRRKATQPAPPCPDVANRVTSSINLTLIPLTLLGKQNTLHAAGPEMRALGMTGKKMHYLFKEPGVGAKQKPHLLTHLLPRRSNADEADKTCFAPTNEWYFGTCQSLRINFLSCLSSQTKSILFFRPACLPATAGSPP